MYLNLFYFVNRSTAKSSALKVVSRVENESKNNEGNLDEEREIELFMQE
jgi:hypothetical protein